MFGKWFKRMNVKLNFKLTESQHMKTNDSLVHITLTIIIM